ncbi:MAG: DUF6089 family protein [Bacteroidota bacterium]|nr:DUF6089 family protein [Bacteroidota bacterium]
MSTTKKTIPALLLLLIGSATYAQNNFRRTQIKPVYSSMENTTEIGINAGMTGFLGDLGGTRGKGEPFSKDLNGISMRPILGLSYGYYPKSWLKVNATFNYTTISGADSVIKTKIHQSLGRFERNLSFRSRVEELSVNGEFYPLQLLSRTHRETLLKPFVGFGVGVFHFNPQAELTGQWIALKPLHLEGEGFTEYPDSKNYSLYQFYIPFNLGFKYRLDDQLSLSFTATFRKTFTDYLDDVSKTYIDPTLFSKYLSPNDAALAKQLYYRGLSSTPPKPGSPRAYSNSNDSYTSLYITLNYNFGRIRSREESVSDRIIKVKRFRKRQ